MIQLQQDVLTLQNVFDVPWEEAKKAWILKDDNSDSNVSQIFANLDLNGLANEVTSILDKGYKIFLMDNQLRIKFLFIEKSTDSASISTNMVCVKSLGFNEALRKGIELFNTTLKVNKPYLMSDYFGDNGGKISVPLISPLRHDQTMLDKMLYQRHSILILKKSDANSYSLSVESMHAMDPNKKLFEIKFNKLVD